MDFYKNADHFCKPYSHGVSGIQYHVLEDLVLEPVDVSFFRKHARIDYNMDEALIRTYVAAARQELEQWAQLSFGRKVIHFQALNIPNNYRLMYGPVDTVDGAKHTGDILQHGGGPVDITFTTKEDTTDLVRVAICRYATGLYEQRENYTTDYEGNVITASRLIDEAKMMLQPIRNVTVW